MKVGHDTTSCTSEPAPVMVHPSQLKPRSSLWEHRVVLVDTPGFDDTYQDDAKILKRIALWLKMS
jgi:hypothetical protein